MASTLPGSFSASPPSGSRTISREFGSGGRELGKRLSDLLHFDYYDKEILYAVARNKRMQANYVSNILENQCWSNFPITFRRSFSPKVSLIQTDLLLEQKEVIEEIACLGKNFIIIGRSADVILQKYQPFNIFVCASLQSKIERCRKRATDGEQLSEKELINKIHHIDKNRIKTREIVGGGSWGNRENYHLTINTSEWDIKFLAPAVKNFYEEFLGRRK